MDELTEFLMSEIWDDIKEFPGYQVSTEGRVRRRKKQGVFRYLLVPRQEPESNLV